MNVLILYFYKLNPRTLLASDTYTFLNTSITHSCLTVINPLSLYLLLDQTFSICARSVSFIVLPILLPSSSPEKDTIRKNITFPQNWETLTSFDVNIVNKTDKINSKAIFAYGYISPAHSKFRLRKIYQKNISRKWRNEMCKLGNIIFVPICDKGNGWRY